MGTAAEEVEAAGEDGDPHCLSRRRAGPRNNARRIPEVGGGIERVQVVDVDFRGGEGREQGGRFRSSAKNGRKQVS